MTQNSQIRVLVFPCGSEPAMEIHAALRYCVNIELYGASSRGDHGEYVYRNYIGGLPYIQDRRFLSEFNAVLDDHRIDLVFATHDSVAEHLSQCRTELAAKVCLGDHRTVALCRDKRETYAFFADEPFCPRVFDARDARRFSSFPIFLKPAIDEGGKGARLIANAEELKFFAPRTTNPVVMEYLPGNEYTVDCFTDRHGGLRFVGARSRERVWAGISVRSQTCERLDEFAEIAARINSRLGFRGLWFFQVKRARDGSLRLLEISSRVAGSMSVHRIQGVNLPLLTAYDAMDRDVEVLSNPFTVTVDRALCSRYRLQITYDTLYIDFDDTLVCRGRVNGAVMMLIYQAHRAGKRVILLTKHPGPLEKTLADFRIASSLFDEIIQLSPDGDKLAAAGNASNAIFIDNAYRERERFLSQAIPVFDVDAVPGLLDWRE